MNHPNAHSNAEADLREVHTTFATQRAILALMLREMTTSYGRSPGGYLWAVLEPVAGIVVMTVIFSAGFRSPPLGLSFALFYASGLLPFLMYGDLSAKLAQTISFSRALLEYPRVTFIDALIARFVLNTLTQFMVNLIVLAGIFLVLAPNTTLDFGKITLAYVMILALAVGVGTLNAFLFLAYPVWQTVWAVINRPIFLISCLFFLFEGVPQPWRDILWFNPLVHAFGEMRDGYYPFYQPTFVSPTYVFAVSALMTMAGLFLLNRYHRDALDK